MQLALCYSTLTIVKVCEHVPWHHCIATNICRRQIPFDASVLYLCRPKESGPCKFWRLRFSKFNHRLKNQIVLYKYYQNTSNLLKSFSFDVQSFHHEAAIITYFVRSKQSSKVDTVITIFTRTKTLLSILAVLDQGATIEHDEKLVAFASRALTNTEFRYSKTEREALQF